MRILISYVNCTTAFLVTATGLVLFVHSLWAGTWENSHLVIFGATYVAIGSGVSVGFHRYGVHDSFAYVELAKWTVRPVLLVFASFSVQSTMWFWCTAHKKHHPNSDKKDDPHSPYCPGGTWLQKVGQFLWAHMFWIPHFRQSNWQVYCRWRKFDWFEKLICRLYILLILFPPAVMWLFFGWQGVTAYLAAIFVWWHLTASVNSIGHSFGSRRLKTGDRSTNLWFIPFFLLILLSFGEFLHRGHHTSQKSARFAIRWYEYLVDVGWWEIWLMKKLGLVKRVHTN